MLASAATDRVIVGLNEGFGLINLRSDANPRVSIYSPTELKSSKVVACSVSAIGHHVCLETDTKTAYLFVSDADAWKCNGVCKIPRRSSCLLFTPDYKAVIFGEKSGNVFKVPLISFTETPEETELTPILGHLSVLSDIALSDDETLIATCDRDEKIRVSLFQQPSIIESFCLGHSAFVSQLTFLPRSEYLVSAGGDGYLRCWKSRTGHELASFKLHFPDSIGFVLDDAPTEDKDTPIIVSRLVAIEPNICVGTCASHPVVFAVPVHISEDSAKWGPMSTTIVPGDHPLVDCAICPLSSGPPSTIASVVGLTAEIPSRLVSWTLSCISATPKATFERCEFGEMCQIYVFPEEVQSRLPTPNPKVELLKSLFKANTDRSMLEAYEENKPIRHQNVLDRRLRHQKTRQKNKRLKQALSS